MYGIETFASYCGSGKATFRIWFWAAEIKSLWKIVDAVSRVGGWTCSLPSNCGGMYLLESVAIGDEAYRQAHEIAYQLNGGLDIV